MNCHQRSWVTAELAGDHCRNEVDVCFTTIEPLWGASVETLGNFGPDRSASGLSVLKSATCKRYCFTPIPNTRTCAVLLRQSGKRTCADGCILANAERGRGEKKKEGEWRKKRLGKKSYFINYNWAYFPYESLIIRFGWLARRKLVSGLCLC